MAPPQVRVVHDDPVVDPDRAAGDHRLVVVVVRLESVRHEARVPDHARPAARERSYRSIPPWKSSWNFALRGTRPRPGLLQDVDPLGPTSARPAASLPRVCEQRYSFSITRAASRARDAVVLAEDGSEDPAHRD
jgi:hypothetical protein